MAKNSPITAPNSQQNNPGNARKRVTFTLHAPGAKSVFLAGSFNDWAVTGRPMKRDDMGTWKTQVDLEPGTHEYRFVVDGEWQDDPTCQERCANSFGVDNCLVHV